MVSQRILYNFTVFFYSQYRNLALPQKWYNSRNECDSMAFNRNMCVYYKSVLLFYLKLNDITAFRIFSKQCNVSIVDKFYNNFFFFLAVYLETNLSRPPTDLAAYTYNSL